MLTSHSQWQNPVKLAFTHVWEIPRKNYLPSPFAVAAPLLQWTPIPSGWQALVPPGVKTTGLPLVLMQPPQYNQPNSAQRQQKCTRTGTQQASTSTLVSFLLLSLPDLQITLFTRLTKKKSLKFRSRVNEQTELIVLGIFIFISFSAALPLHKLPTLEGNQEAKETQLIFCGCSLLMWKIFSN